MRHPSLLSLAAVAVLALPALSQTPLSTELVVNGLAKPLWCGSPPGDNTRLFVLEQDSADIEVVNLLTGTKNALPFLDLSGKVNSAGNERGLLGMAFDPDYQNTGHIFVNYTRTGDGATIVERYTAFNDDVGNLGSGLVIVGPISQPQSNHNGGGIAFGADGMLYVGMGDGGNGNDVGPGHHEPGGNAQWGLTLLGKMLRVKKDGTVDASNPFVGNPNFIDSIWAYGLRNPWRFSFDRDTGDLWIGDVGQNAREEIDFQSASSGGGENYGWRCMEGFLCTGLSGCTCNDPSLELPIQNYGHGGGNCSVTGGYVYRGDAIPDLKGAYFYGDYCSATIWSLRYDGVSVSELTTRTAELDPPGAASIGFITAFGEDDAGELYICDQNGEIFRVIPDNAFTGLGCELAGTNGAPVLHGEGTLAIGSPGALVLTNGNPSSAGALFASIGLGSANFKGGVVKTIPLLLNLPVATDGNGDLTLAWLAWPPGVPSGTTLGFQIALQDAGAPVGVSLSNALAGLVP
ncbi:MAG: PQQ-dependent sugar dehydrogenase [Planctomycetota bacterium]|jgi:glucose/arabinose dehydrogenase